MRIYGEMVNLLAARGDLRGALALEKAWNRAPSGAPVALLCGYSSSHFGDPATGRAARHLQHTTRSATNTTARLVLVERLGLDDGQIASALICSRR